MASKQLTWCCKQRNGISLVEPNKNLSGAFIEKAERYLEEMKHAKYRESQIHFAYYVMYESVYAILQRIGIKCEIHTCTFECMKVFLSEHFTAEECSFMEKSHTARNDATYYANKKVPDAMADEMMKRAPLFLIKSKSVLDKITETRIRSVREELKKLC
jgi:uncharacterized protein (UPF0332 family)